MQKESILLVDDEPEIREIISLYMKREGFHLIEATCAKEAITEVKRSNPNLILLDVLLPDKNGTDICQEIRKLTKAPIIFISCKDSELDKIVGLTVGGDDYISKPFSPNELVARVKAHLRRYEQLTAPTIEATVQERTKELYSNSITLHIQQHICKIEGKDIYLSAKEFKLLHFFMEHPFQVFSAEHIIQQIWGHDSEIDNKTIMVHIGNIRKKIGDDPKQPSIIVTIRGAGYKFNEKVQQR